MALPDNQHALSVSVGNIIKLFNVNDGAVLRTFTHHTGNVRPWRCCPTVSASSSASPDNTARIAYHGLAPLQSMKYVN